MAFGAGEVDLPRPSTSYQQAVWLFRRSAKFPASRRHYCVWLNPTILHPDVWPPLIGFHRWFLLLHASEVTRLHGQFSAGCVVCADAPEGVARHWLKEKARRRRCFRHHRHDVRLTDERGVQPGQVWLNRGLAGDGGNLGAFRHALNIPRLAGRWPRRRLCATGARRR